MKTSAKRKPQSAEPRVVHCRKEPYDVYIGRPSPWGNTYVIGKDGTRKEVIAKHRTHVMSDPRKLRDIRRKLKGKVLGRWCAPKACHGDILLEIANS